VAEVDDSRRQRPCAVVPPNRGQLIHMAKVIDGGTLAVIVGDPVTTFASREVYPARGTESHARRVVPQVRA